MQKSWNTLTPKELKLAKIISIVFLVTSLFIFFILSKILGTILLVIWMLYGSGPFILGSKDSIKNIIHVLKTVEPGYNSWEDKEIEDQIKAIWECGYKWFEKKGKVGFKHSKTGLYLKIAGLHTYKPEDIKKVYNEVWSKDDPEQVKKRDVTEKKLKKAILNNATEEEIESILKENLNRKK